VAQGFLSAAVLRAVKTYLLYKYEPWFNTVVWPFLEPRILRWLERRVVVPVEVPTHDVA
jgi:hypothetical protein